MAVSVYTCIAMHSSCVIYTNMFMQARIQVVVSRAPSVTVMSSHSAPLTSQQTTGCNLRGTAKKVFR